MKEKNLNAWGESSLKTGNEKNILRLGRKVNKLEATISLDKQYQKRISLFGLFPSLSGDQSLA